MAGTPLQNLVVPSLSDPPNGPSQFLAFGTAAEKLMNMSFATAVARDAAITAPVAGMEVYLSTPKQKTLYDGTGWIVMAEPWTAWPAQLDQGATTNIAKTIVTCEYKRSDGMIDVAGTFNFTGTGTAANPLTSTLPIASLWAASTLVGSCTFFDASASQRYVGVAELNGVGLGFGVDVVSSASFGQAPSIAVASGDILRWSARYRMVTRYS